MIRFQIYIGQDEQFHWRLKAANNEIVCWSEGYSTKQAAYESVHWVAKNALGSPIEEI